MLKINLDLKSGLGAIIHYTVNGLENQEGFEKKHSRLKKQKLFCRKQNVLTKFCECIRRFLL